MDKICYIGGAGRLGLSSAVWSAEKGILTYAADINVEAIDKINSGISPIAEPLVEDLINKNLGTTFFATTNLEEGIQDSDLIFILVPTPSLPDGSFSIEYVLDACKVIGKVLDGYAVIVVVSTVMPMHTAIHVKMQLEESSGKTCGKDFGLCYTPEFIRQGSIVHDFANPDYIIIGEFDGWAGSLVEDYYKITLSNNAPIKHMSLTSAEIAKIGLNSAVVTKLGIANQLAWLCQYYPNADARDVLSAIGTDSRIGSKYFGVGTWPAGPCFPRDNRALISAGEYVGLDLPITRATDDFALDQVYDLFMLITNNASPNPIGILGITYKPGVDIIEESQGLLLAKRLEKLNLEIKLCDPGVESSSLEDVLYSCKTLVLMTPWEEFKALENMDLEGKLIIDCWDFLDEEKLNCTYIRLGRGK